MAMAPDGRFDIAYERQFSAVFDIFASQYDGGGGFLRGDTVNIDRISSFTECLDGRLRQRRDRL